MVEGSSELQFSHQGYPDTMSDADRLELLAKIDEEKQSASVTQPEPLPHQERTAEQEHDATMHRVLALTIKHCENLAELAEVVIDQIYYLKPVAAYLEKIEMARATDLANQQKTREERDKLAVNLSPLEEYFKRIGVTDDGKPLPKKKEDIPPQPIPQLQHSGGVYPGDELFDVTANELKAWLDAKYPQIEKLKPNLIDLSFARADAYETKSDRFKIAHQLRQEGKVITAQSILAHAGITPETFSPELYVKFESMLQVELNEYLRSVQAYAQEQLSSTRQRLKTYSEIVGGKDSELTIAFRKYETLQANPFVDQNKLVEAWKGVFKLRECLPVVHAYIKGNVEAIWQKHLKDIDFPEWGDKSESDEKLKQAAKAILAECGVDIPTQSEYPDEFNALVHILTGADTYWLKRDIIGERQKGVKFRYGLDAEGNEVRFLTDMDWPQVERQIARTVSMRFKMKVVPSSVGSGPASKQKIYVTVVEPINGVDFGEGSALKIVFHNEETLSRFILQLALDEAKEVLSQKKASFVWDGMAIEKTVKITTDSAESSLVLTHKFLDGFKSGSTTYYGYNGPYGFNVEFTHNQVFMHATGFLIGAVCRPWQSEGERKSGLSKILEAMKSYFEGFNNKPKNKDQKLEIQDLLSFAEKQYARVPGVKEGETIAQAIGIEHQTT